MEMGNGLSLKNGMTNFSLSINGCRVQNKEDLQSIDPNTPQHLRIMRILSFLFSGDDFLEVWTSGSTGDPKAIKLSRELILQSAKRSGEYFKFNKGQKVLLCIPLEKIGGIMLLVRAAMFEQDVVSIHSKINVIQALNNEHFYFASMIPMQVDELIKQHLKREQIEHLLIGGASISPYLLFQILNLKTAFYQSYGMTETASHIAIRKLNGGDKSEYYRALGEISLSQDTGGVLKIKLGLTQKEYTTTDRVELISEKEFRYLGRIDNVINCSGYKISPEKLEEKIKNLVAQSPIEEILTSELMIYGEKISGEKIEIVLRIEAVAFETQRLMELLKKNLKSIECPQRIEFVVNLQRTSNGKILR